MKLNPRLCVSIILDGQGKANKKPVKKTAEGPAAAPGLSRAAIRGKIEPLIGAARRRILGKKEMDPSMSALGPSRPDKSSPEFHRKSYQLFAPFMDRGRFGSMLLLLRQKDIADASARRRAGLDVVDVFSIGTDPTDPQTLHIHALRSGDETVVLEHTYMYWAQLVTLRDCLERRYQLRIPGLNRPQKENGLLACVELDGAHMAKLPDRYVTWTFQLKARGKHRCPEETGSAPADCVVTLGELGGVCCPYCLAEELDLNLD